MNKLPHLLGAIFATLVAFPNTVLSQQSTDAYAEQRALFVKAEKMIWKADSEDFREVAAQLQDYPLYPYLQQQVLMHKLYYSKRSQVEMFLAEHDQQPVATRLRAKWLKYLYRRQKDEAFLSVYQPQSDTELYCHFLQLELKQGMSHAELLPLVDELWLVGKSQPKSCDPLFKIWQQADRRTEDMVWQRLSLAATKGKYTLIPYLQSLLPESERYLGDLYLKVRRSPSYVSRPSRFPGSSARETEILTYGLKRLIWRDRDLALKSWDKLNAKFSFSQQEFADIAYSFALGLATDGHPNAHEWLWKVPDDKVNQLIVQWRISDSLRDQEWGKLKDILQALPPEFQQSEQGQYWLARSLTELGQDQQAQQIFTQLSQQRHYYGFLASSQLAQPPAYQNRPYQLDPGIADAISNEAALIRARELYLLSRFTDARREWNYAMAGKDELQKQHAARLAYEWGWYDRAIFGFAASQYNDDVEARFPLAHQATIMQQAKKNDIAPAWAFAVARRESSFMSDAYSHAGAVGLMQVLPATATVIERSKVSKRELMKPKRNIQLGTRYLRLLMDKNNDNQLLATASYNAGYHRVKKWVPEQALPADIWVETIPYKETREYVKSVMAYQQIYLNLLGQDESLFDQLVEQQIAP